MQEKKKQTGLQSEINKKLKKLTKNFPIRLEKKQFLLISALLVLITLYLLRSLFFVAFVNGVPVTRFEFNKEMEKSIGKQTLDSLVTKSLVMKEINKQGVVISDEDVQKEIENISLMIEGQGGTLDQALALQGQTREDLERNIRMQKAIEVILKDKTEVTDEEIEDYFEENSEIFGEDAELEDVKEDIRQQLSSEKLNSEYGSWLSKIKEESNIIYLVNY